MHPLLFKIGSIPVHSYGMLIAIGFLVAIYVIRRLAIQSKLNVDHVLDLAFWCFLVGFIGARLLFIVTRWSYFMEDPASIFRVWEGGLVFFGGPLLAVPFAVWFVRKNKMSPWKTMDVAMPGLAIGHAFGRLGCLAAGCCYGKPTGTSFGVKLYSDLVEKQYQGINLHPTQLYESGALFILFFGLLWVHKHKSFDGQVGLTYFMAYPVIRSLVEIYRGDLIRGFVIDGILSTSQFISIFAFLMAGAVLIWRLKQVDLASSRLKS